MLSHSKRLQGGAWQSGVHEPIEPCPGTSPRSPVCPVSPLVSQPEGAFTRLPALCTSHTFFFAVEVEQAQARVTQVTVKHGVTLEAKVPWLT